MSLTIAINKIPHMSEFVSNYHVYVDIKPRGATTPSVISKMALPTGPRQVR